MISVTDPADAAFVLRHLLDELPDPKPQPAWTPGDAEVDRVTRNIWRRRRVEALELAIELLERNGETP